MEISRGLDSERLNQIGLEEDIVRRDHRQAIILEFFQKIRSIETNTVKMTFAMEDFLGDGIDMGTDQIERLLSGQT